MEVPEQEVMAMAEPARALEDNLPPRPDVSHLVMEDNEPVDNWFQERQQRLLPDSLYASWKPDRAYLAAADVGLFYKISEKALVPDVMVSLDVTVPDEWWKDENRSYLVWEFGKPPEMVIEIVSNKKGGEEDKLARYAQIGVAYYTIFDPRLYLGKRSLRVYALHAGRYVDVLDPSWLEEIGIGVTLWDGSFEGMSATWLRWCSRDGQVLLTGTELAAQQEERADQERQRADQERQRAERMAARLRELGLDPDE